MSKAGFRLREATRRLAGHAYRCHMDVSEAFSGVGRFVSLRATSGVTTHEAIIFLPRYDAGLQSCLAHCYT